jgi:hypothetical protein
VPCEGNADQGYGARLIAQQDALHHGSRAGAQAIAEADSGV